MRVELRLHAFDYAPAQLNHLDQRTKKKVELDLSYKERFYSGAGAVYSPDAYTRLILDTLRGRQSAFVRADELLESWKVGRGRDGGGFKGGGGGGGGVGCGGGVSRLPLEVQYCTVPAGSICVQCWARAIRRHPTPRARIVTRPVFFLNR